MRCNVLSMAGKHTSAYQLKDAVDDIRAIYLIVYLVHPTECIPNFVNKILVLTRLIRHFKVRR